MFGTFKQDVVFAVRTFLHPLSSERVAIGASYLCGTALVSDHLDTVKRTVILLTAMMNALADSALNAGISSFVIHFYHIPFFFARKKYVQKRAVYA